jgi:S1-C subfamily serine protease
MGVVLLPKVQPSVARWWWLAGAAIAAFAATAIAAIFWSDARPAQPADPAKAERLQGLLTQQASLEKQLASNPQTAPTSCPPGQSLRPATAGPTAAASDAASNTSGAPLPTTGEATALNDAALAKRLEEATAIVLVDGGRAGTGMGTGFFISPTLLVTNRHVVEDSTTTSVLVSSKALGSLRRATVVKVTRNAEIGNPDFALLRMEDGTSAGALDLSSEAPKLAGVVAAGYPAVVVKSDPSFQRMLSGDISAAPDLNLTKGAVQSLQAGPDGTPLMVHTASIAKGNSGGPLVDGCGRVVGVNTFINVDQSQSAKINYAIRSPAIAGFVKAAGATVRMDTRPCAARG